MEFSSISRLLRPPDRSFFLFGPRAVGKSYWLKRHFAQAKMFNLLETRLYLELSRDPSLLEAKIGPLPPQSWVCIDEVQKIPSLLDEVHRLIENKQLRFALSGSSARKLKRGGANLLAGRAVTRQMETFCYQELGERFLLEQNLQWGSLPLVVLQPESAQDILASYVETYIKEEIKEEGLVRRVEPFLRFLEIAALYNGQQLNRGNLAREALVPRSTVDTYFSILEDTLLGHFLPAFRPEAKVREQSHPKFYWFDPGVARAAAGLLYDPLDPLWQGKALETMLFHELRVFNQSYARYRPIYYYRSSVHDEIDFIIETRKRSSSAPAHVVCIEVKLSKRWDRRWEKAMRSLKSSGKLVVEKMFGLYAGNETYHFDGIDVLPVQEFLARLYREEVF